MRTGRTVTVFQKLEPRPPRKIGADTPPKNWSRHPPENLEQAPPKNTPPKIWSRPPRKKYPPQKLEQAPPPVNRITDTCKNITLAKTSFRPVISVLYSIPKDSVQRRLGEH